MATNNYYTFKCENEKEAERSEKRKKKIVITPLGVIATAFGAVAATAGAAYLYHKGFSNGAEKMKAAAQTMINESAGFGAACGYARARLNDGSFDESSVKEFLTACVDKMTEEGIMSPGAVTADEIDTITAAMVMTAGQ